MEYFEVEFSSFSIVPRSYPPIVHVLVNVSVVLFQNRREVTSHGALEEGRCVAQSEVHHRGVIGPETHFYCGFVAIFRADAYVIISPANIHFGKEGLSLECLHGFLNAGDRVVVALHPFVDLLVIDDWPKFVSPFFLRDEITGACYG